jgi:hypothetical protein
MGVTLILPMLRVAHRRALAMEAWFPAWIAAATTQGSERAAA